MRPRQREKMRSFAVADGRTEKARKIEAVLADFMKASEISGLRILDIGCGSGQIAAHFAARNEVTAVDVVDQLTIPGRIGIRFSLVTGEALPFADGSFDVVISNHVVAYLRNRALHFREMARVLGPGGAAYFASPNRNFPLEPHTKYPLLRYLPARTYSRVMVHLTGRDETISVPSRGSVLREAAEAGLCPIDYTVRIIRDPARYKMEQRGVSFLPGWFSALSPTNVFILAKPSPSGIHE